ncbi:TatD family hydrolase [Christensenella hongkongensis]|uniref:TatD family hydrolase n=1 Tax=Christensenella hongkongensis TaxID=270498 RepID=UPI002A7638DC|nr:TatD family hydrolase [Christensenella hongkongensis]
MMLFDTHAHLLDERFDEDREELIGRLPLEGVEYVVEASSDLADSIRAAALAKEHRMIYSAVGVHPHSAGEWDQKTAVALRSLAKEEKVVAIGEIGLDYHYDFSPRETQKKAFEQQVELALEVNLPIVVHSREATADTLEILRKFPQVRGELHCFSGSAETARELVKMGFYIAFGGALTFKNARKTLEAAQAVPMERLLIETDCPYMTPVPLRGKRNEPAYVRYVAQRLAEVKNVDEAEIARVTMKNAKRFFDIESGLE